MGPPKVDNLLIKPAGPDCNLACGYCFYRPKSGLYPGSGPKRMPPAVLAEMVRQYTAMGGGMCSFCWQGGEPTLMGTGFFRQAMDHMRRFGSPGQVMANSIQTNGILIDDEWASLFARGRFFVGLSMDGPAGVHDRYRRDLGGAPSFSRVERAARVLERHGVPFNILAVVTRETAGMARELWDFFPRAGFMHLQFIPVAEAATGGVSPDGETPVMPVTVPPAAWGDFLCGLFDLWAGQDPFRVSVRTFDGLAALAAGEPGAECIFLDRCARYAVVEHNGDVYACDFLVEPGWKLGNLMEAPLWTMFRGPRWEAFRELKPSLPGECRECRWLAWCGGGCPTHRRLGGGKPYFCEAYKRFFEHAAPAIVRITGGRLPGK